MTTSTTLYARKLSTGAVAIYESLSARKHIAFFPKYLQRPRKSAKMILLNDIYYELIWV